MIGRLIFLLLGNLLVAQDVSYKQFTVDDGLPSNETYGILEDRNGLIWIGTDHGVSRFNGYEFKTFTTDDGLPDNTIFDFYEDHAGRIWFFTFNGKIGYYFNATFRQVDVGSQNHILAINVDRKDHVSIKFSSSNTWIHFNLVNDEIDKSTLVEEKFPALKLNKMASNLIDTVTQIATLEKLKNGSVFFKTGKILNSVLIDKNTRCQIHLNMVIILDSNFTVKHYFKVPKEFGLIISIGMVKDYWYLSTSTNNVLKYDLSTYQYLGKQDMGSHRISSLFEDLFGSVWFSTVNGGVLYVPNVQLKVRNLNRGVSNPYFFSKSPGYTTIVYTDNSIVTYANNGVVVNSTRIKGTLENIRRENGRVFVAAQLEFLELNASGKEVRRVNQKEKKYRIHPGSNLIGFYDGLIAKDGKLYNCSKNVIYVDTIIIPIKGSRRLISLAEQGDTLWAGGFNGLFAISKKTKKQLRLPSDPILRNRINKIKSNEGDLFMTTRGAGLMILHNNNVYQIKQKDGLISNSTKQVEINGKSIWVTSNSGVSKIHIESYSPFRYQIYNFGEQDGIFSKDIRDIQLFNDSVFILTEKQIYSFPEYYDGNTSIPKLTIAGLFMNEDQAQKESRLTFAYDENQLTLKFLGLYYPDPNGLTYHYSSDNGTTWQQTKERSITLLNLSPGNYTLMMKAISANGNESNTETIRFTIFPPFWKTWWFILCSIGLLFIIAYALIKLSIIRIRRVNKLENELYKLEHKALASQMNPHFIFNAMNSIQHYILKKDKYEAYEYLGRFAKLMRSILNNSEKELNSLHDEIDQLRSYLELEQIRFEHAFDFEIIVDDDIAVDQVLIPGMLIQPFAENSIRHGFAHQKGNYKLEIHFSMRDRNVEVTIKDNGIGRLKAREFSQESGHKSLGININKRRLELMNTLNKQQLSIRIDDLYDQENPIGTLVSIMIPIQDQD